METPINCCDFILLKDRKPSPISLVIASKTQCSAAIGLGHPKPKTQNSQLTTHNSQLTTHNSQLTTHNSQLTTHNSQLTTHYSQPKTQHPTPNTQHPTPNTQHPLLTTLRLLEGRLKTNSLSKERLFVN
jgi:hypothetical protein